MGAAHRGTNSRLLCLVQTVFLSVVGCWSGQVKTQMCHCVGVYDSNLGVRVPSLHR